MPSTELVGMIMPWRSEYRKVLLIVQGDRQRTFLSAFLRVRGCGVEASPSLPATEAILEINPDVIVLATPTVIADCASIKASRQLNLLPVVVLLPRTDPGIGSHLWQSAIAAGAIDCKPFPVGHDELELLDLRLKGFTEQKRLCEELEHAEQVIIAVSLMVEARDPNTGDHCYRLYNAGAKFANFLGMDHADTRSLALAGYLHDIGKLGVRDNVLLKPGKLTPDEWEIMKQHPLMGENICQPLRSMRGVLPIIRHHHERWDGSGYPDGLQGAAIPFLAQVFQLLDITDALAYDRPYKKAMPLDRVFSILDEEVENGWRDPALVSKLKEFIAGELANG